MGRWEVMQPTGPRRKEGGPRGPGGHSGGHGGLGGLVVHAAAYKKWRGPRAAGKIFGPTRLLEAIVGEKMKGIDWNPENTRQWLGPRSSCEAEVALG